MQSRPRILAFAIVCVLSMLRPGIASGEDYLPLAIGGTWYYENDLGEAESMWIVGDQDVLGAPTRVRRQERADQVFENYWSRDENGSLYLHGARNLTYGAEWAFVPPIEAVNAPLFLNKAWVAHDVQLYHLDGSPTGADPFDYPFGVFSEGEVIVPAGTFYSYGVGFNPDSMFVPRGDGKVFDVFGRRIQDGQLRDNYDITDWYSDNVGLAQRTRYTGEQHALQLIWWNQPTPTRTTTWGRIKAAFESAGDKQGATR